MRLTNYIPLFIDLFPMYPVIEFFQKLLDTNDFPPRWFCGNWSDFHGWLYIFSNLAIWAAYFSIPVLLFYFLIQRSDISFRRLFWWFILFISFCGITHLLEAVLFWYPIYRFNAIMLFSTAVVSLGTVWELRKQLPYLVSLRTPAELRITVARKTAALSQSVDDLEQSKQRLESQNQQLEEFANIASHNLRAPMANLQGLFQLWDMTDDLDERDELMQRIRETSGALTQTIEDLARVVAIGQQPTLGRAPLSFEATFLHITESLQVDIENGQSNIDYDFSAAPEVQYNPVYLESILQNLLTNAIKYKSPHRPLRIKIWTVRSEEGIHLYFKDNGRGLDMQRFGHKLFQLHQTFHQHQDSRGVGLFITRKQIESMGGYIKAEGAVDKGMLFHLFFEQKAGKVESN